MIRLIGVLAALTCLAYGVHAEVVVAPTGINLSSNSDTTDLGSFGFRFTTSGSTSPDGRWALEKAVLRLASTGSATANSANFYLYEMNGNQATFRGSQSGFSLGGTTIAAGGTSFDINFSPGSAFGQVGVLGSGLKAGTDYLLGFELTITNPENAFIVESNTFDTTLARAWQVNNSYFLGPNPMPTSGTTDFSSFFGNEAGLNYAFTLEASAVPEPGTLILGSIAAMGGAGGWWARRRRKAAANKAAEQVAA